MKPCPRFVPLATLILLGLLAVGCKARTGPVVDALLAGERNGSFVVPFSQNGIEMDQPLAYQQQQRYIQASTGDRGKIVGYKIAYASEVAQVRANVRGPAFGQLTDAMQVPDGGSVVLAGFRRFAIEAEIALVIGKTIDKPIYTADDIRPYVASVHPALDIPDIPFDYNALYTATDMIAANTAARRFAIGPGRDPLRFDMDTLDISLLINRQRHSRGIARDAMGGPYQSLVWLQQQLASQGKTLQAGQIILTGAPARPYMQTGPKVDVSATYTADIASLGNVSVVVQ